MEITNMLMIIYYLKINSLKNSSSNELLLSNIQLITSKNTNNLTNNYILSKVSTIIIIGDATLNRVSIPMNKHNSIFSIEEISYNAYETPKQSINNIIK